MWSISVKIKLLLAVMVFLFFNNCAFQQRLKSSDKNEKDFEKQIVLTIDSLLKSGDFVKAEKYARLFERRYPNSPFIDDVAYRLAYLHVIGDDQNPFYDYQKARKAFERFLKKFPESQYALACNNWLKVLYLNFQLKKRVAELEKQNQILKKQVDEKASKITQLQSTLRDIEKVIKR